MSGFRLPAGGRVDRGAPLRFTFDGVEYAGFRGDTLASALLANGVDAVGRSIYRGRPRGIGAAGPEEPNGLVQVELAGGSEPMLRATEVELFDGLVARGLAGRGRLAPEPDPAIYDHVNAHCDVLVVGAGRAGLAAADEAAASGARVILAEAQPELASRGADRNGVDAVAARLDAAPEARVLLRTTAVGCYDAGYVVLAERRTDHLDAPPPPGVSRARLWHVRARRIVLATGALERPVAFAGNDLPGVMLAGAAREYAERFGVAAGRRAVVFTANDTGYATAAALAEAGVEIAAVVDPRPGDRPVPPGAEHLPGAVVCAAEGEDRVTAAVVGERAIPCDLLLVSGGWSPDVHLLSQAQGTVRWDAGACAFVPDRVPDGYAVAGRAAGVHANGVPLWAVAPPPGRDWDECFVDQQRDATVADLRRAVAAGLRSPEHVKRFTTIGTANDQGRTSGVVALGILAGLLETEISALGPTTFRPPYAPVSFSLLAGRHRGALSDPVRTTAIHPWHVEHGAEFENVGQWQRPWYYPRPGEDMDAAVLRECRAARSGVAMMDASTLGKIDVQGPDAETFLNRMYTGDFSKLAPGKCKYGVLCGADGMVLDDGVTMRLAPDRFIVTTTTGNAAKVLDWFEEWLQTEWPELHVHCTSVTEQWATVAIAGPRSRDVVRALAPGLDADDAAFPFMAIREATVAGLAARVCRVSFSGELAFEVNVPSVHGLALWEAVWAAGQPYGITPYGTETMHVLRAEKGYVIVGQETDGTQTPQDLGLGWMVSQRKGDFVGRRSHRRPDARRPDRKQLVGLLPDERLPEGAQLVTDPGAAPPVPMDGHVTSSYDSAALGRPFALALLERGRERHGETVHAPLTDRVVAARVCEPVFYDPEGTRRDGDGRDGDTGNGAPPAAVPDAGARRAPLAELEAAFAAASGEDVTLAERPFLAQVGVRLHRGPGGPSAAEAALGFALPAIPNTVAGANGRRALWLGPDEWLVVGEPGSETALEAELAEALGGGLGSVVDLSANRTAIELRGPRAPDVLAKGCALDLHPRAFGPGRCAQTLLARAQVILEQLDGAPAYRLYVRPSFAGYVATWLLDAGAEFSSLRSADLRQRSVRATSLNV